MCVFSAILKPHDRLMGLDLPHGGHLSHGFQTETKKISMVSVRAAGCHGPAAALKPPLLKREAWRQAARAPRGTHVREAKAAA